MPPEADPGPEPIPTDTPARRPRPIEEIEWKDRALKAEAALEAAAAQIETLTERCATHERNIESITRTRAEADAEALRVRALADALAPHHPIDPDLCATLIEREIGDVEPSDLASGAARAAARLASERPYLFRPPPRTRAGAAMAGEPGAPTRTPTEDALEAARTTGDRAHLLRYLRLRRGA